MAIDRDDEDHAGPIERPFPKGAYPQGSGSRTADMGHVSEESDPEGPIVRPEIPKSRLNSFINGIIGRRR